MHCGSRTQRMRAGDEGARMRRVNTRERQTRVGPTLRHKRRPAHRQRGMAHQKPAEGPPIRRRIAKTGVRVRLRGVPRDERQAPGQFAPKRNPDRRERIVVRRLRKQPRRQHREVVVVMLRILIMVVVIMPD